MTIGYGDLEVQSAAGKAAFVYWAFLAVPTMTILVASMGATFLIGVKALTGSMTLWYSHMKAVKILT
jgi:potassium channel subfamily K